MVILGAAVSFGILLPERNRIIQPAIAGSNTPPATQSAVEESPNAAASADPTINPNPAALPSYLTADNLDQWIGKPWRELDIFKVMPKWPTNMDHGKRFVIFYSRTCEHCEAMFKETLAVHPIGASVVAVEIPNSRTVLTGEGAWTIPPGTPCELMALPLGPLWMITPPLAVAINDGVVTCASEQDYKKCLGLQ